MSKRARIIWYMKRAAQLPDFKAYSDVEWKGYLKNYYKSFIQIMSGEEDLGQGKDEVAKEGFTQFIDLILTKQAPELAEDPEFVNKLKKISKDAGYNVEGPWHTDDTDSATVPADIPRPSRLEDAPALSAEENKALESLVPKKDPKFEHSPIISPEEAKELEKMVYGKKGRTNREGQSTQSMDDLAGDLYQAGLEKFAKEVYNKPFDELSYEEADHIKRMQNEFRDKESSKKNEEGLPDWWNAERKKTEDLLSKVSLSSHKQVVAGSRDDFIMEYGNDVKRLLINGNIKARELASLSDEELDKAVDKLLVRIRDIYDEEVASEIESILRGANSSVSEIADIGICISNNYGTEARQVVNALEDAFGNVRDAKRGDGKGTGGPLQEDGGADTCVCSKCGYKKLHKKGIPCADLKCPECDIALSGKDDESVNQKLHEWWQSKNKKTAQYYPKRVRITKNIYYDLDKEDLTTEFSPDYDLYLIKDAIMTHAEDGMYTGGGVATALNPDWYEVIDDVKRKAQLETSCPICSSLDTRSVADNMYECMDCGSYFDPNTGEVQPLDENTSVLDSSDYVKGQATPFCQKHGVEMTPTGAVDANGNPVYECVQCKAEGATMTVSGKKEAPTCKKCNKKHWPFQPCKGIGAGDKKEAQIIWKKGDTALVYIESVPTGILIELDEKDSKLDLLEVKIVEEPEQLEAQTPTNMILVSYKSTNGLVSIEALMQKNEKKAQVSDQGVNNTTENVETFTKNYVGEPVIETENGADRYGVFAYSGDGVIQEDLIQYFSKGDLARSEASNVMSVLSTNDIGGYVEVWEKDENGLFGNRGEPLVHLETFDNREQYARADIKIMSPKLAYQMQAAGLNSMSREAVEKELSFLDWSKIEDDTNNISQYEQCVKHITGLGKSARLASFIFEHRLGLPGVIRVLKSNTRVGSRKEKHTVVYKEQEGFVEREAVYYIKDGTREIYLEDMSNIKKGQKIIHPETGAELIIESIII